MSLYAAYVPKERENRVINIERLMDEIEVIHWPLVIDGLVAAGYSVKRQAVAIGVAAPTIQGWQKGSIPNYEAGRKLLVLYAAVGIPVAAKQSKG